MHVKNTINLDLEMSNETVAGKQTKTSNLDSPKHAKTYLQKQKMLDSTEVKCRILIPFFLTWNIGPY